MILRSEKYLIAGSERHDFDLFINATGYEERAGTLVRTGRVTADEYLSLLFDQHRVLAYEQNRKIMSDVGASFVSDPIDFFYNEFCKYATGLVHKKNRKIRIGVDVSSMNRTMSATVLSSIIAYSNIIDAAELFYVPAKFRRPRLQFMPIQQIGAVLPELSGFDSEPALPLGAILGLGYEYGTAVGLINQLEPQLTICFRAIGHDQRFEREVRRANLDFDFSACNVKVSEYDLLDVKSAFRHIDNITYALVNNYRIVMVPMGQKILAALFVLLAIRYFGRIALWRVARQDSPIEIQADEMYVVAGIDVECKGVGPDRWRKFIKQQIMEPFPAVA